MLVEKGKKMATAPDAPSKSHGLRAVGCAFEPRRAHRSRQLYGKQFASREKTTSSPTDGNFAKAKFPYASASIRP
ncbi:MAG TPA: hypothetical protein DCO65_00400, partial [Spartobacteria bacterium]|nr:hypothetical protein [Spartobacteria bacterium]